MNFSIASRIFLLVLAILLATDYFIGLNGMLYAIPIVVYIGLLTYGSIHIRANFFLEAINFGSTQEKVVALTFDDGPCAKTTAQVLDVLKEEQVKGTFFCIGKHIPSNEKLLRRMDQEGHLVGNHSYNHGNLFDLLPTKKVVAELEKTNELIYAAIGKKPQYFRPPYGVTNPMIAKAVKQIGCVVIGWNIRSLDTVSTKKVKLIKRIHEGLKPGAIILLHDNQTITLETLPIIIQTIKGEGYRIVGLEEVIFSG